MASFTLADYSAQSSEKDPKKLIEGYRGAVQVSLLGEGQYDDEVMADVDSQLLQHAKDNKIDLQGFDAPQDDDTQLVARHALDTGDAEARDAAGRLHALRDPSIKDSYADRPDEYAAKLEEAQIGYEAAVPPETREAARRAALSRGEIPFATFQDKEGNRRVELGPEILATAGDDQALAEMFKANLGLDRNLIGTIRQKLQTPEGFNVPLAKIERQQDAMAAIDGMVQANPKDFYQLDALRTAVSDGTMDNLDPLLSQLDDTMSGSPFYEQFNDQERKDFLKDYITRQSTPKLDPEAPEKGLRTLSTGEVHIPTALMMNKATFDKVLPKLPEGQQAMAAAQREQVVAAYAKDAFKTIIARRGDEFINLHAEQKAAGKTDTEILDEWTADPKNQSTAYEYVSGIAESIPGALVTAAAAIPALAGNKTAAGMIRYYDTQTQQRKEFANLVGKDLGWEYDLSTAVAPVVVDIFATKGAAAVARGTVGAAARAAIKPVVRGFFGATVRQETKGLVNSFVKGSVRRELEREGLGAVGDVAVNSLKPTEVLGAIGRDLTAGLSKAEMSTGIFAGTFNRTAGQSYVQTYSTLEGLKNPDGSRKFNDEQVRDMAVKHAVVVATMAGLTTLGFNAFGAAGLERIFDGGLTRKQLGGVFSRLKKDWGNMAPAVKEGIDMTDANRMLTTMMAKSIAPLWKIGVEGAKGEVPEEALQNFLEDIATSYTTGEKFDINKSIRGALYAGMLGGVLGGGATVTADIVSSPKVDAAREAAVRRNALLTTAAKLDATAPQTAAAVRQLALEGIPQAPAAGAGDTAAAAGPAPAQEDVPEGVPAAGVQSPPGEPPVADPSTVTTNESTPIDPASDVSEPAPLDEVQAGDADEAPAVTPEQAAADPATRLKTLLAENGSARTQSGIAPNAEPEVREEIERLREELETITNESTPQEANTAQGPVATGEPLPPTAGSGAEPLGEQVVQPPMGEAGSESQVGTDNQAAPVDPTQAEARVSDGAVSEGAARAEDLIPADVLEQIKTYPDFYEVVSKDALNGSETARYLVFRKAPKAVEARIKKEFKDGAPIAVIEQAIEDATRNTAQEKQRAKDLKVALASETPSKELAAYRSAESALETARQRRNDPKIGAEWETRNNASAVSEAQRALRKAGDALVAAQGKVAPEQSSAPTTPQGPISSNNPPLLTPEERARLVTQDTRPSESGQRMEAEDQVYQNRPRKQTGAELQAEYYAQQKAKSAPPSPTPSGPQEGDTITFTAPGQGISKPTQGKLAMGRSGKLVAQVEVGGKAVNYSGFKIVAEPTQTQINSQAVFDALDLDATPAETLVTNTLVDANPGEIELILRENPEIEAGFTEVINVAAPGVITDGMPAQLKSELVQGGVSERVGILVAAEGGNPLTFTTGNGLSLPNENTPQQAQSRKADTPPNLVSGGKPLAEPSTRGSAPDSARPNMGEPMERNPAGEGVPKSGVSASDAARELNAHGGVADIKVFLTSVATTGNPEHRPLARLLLLFPSPPVAVVKFHQNRLLDAYMREGLTRAQATEQIEKIRRGAAGQRGESLREAVGKSYKDLAEKLNAQIEEAEAAAEKAEAAAEKVEAAADARAQKAKSPQAIAEAAVKKTERANARAEVAAKKLEKVLARAKTAATKAVTDLNAESAKAIKGVTKTDTRATEEQRALDLIATEGTLLLQAIETATTLDEIATAVADWNANTPVNVDAALATAFKDQAPAGYFSPRTGQIIINSENTGPSGAVGTLLHELIHAATEASLVNPTPEQAKVLKRIDGYRKTLKARAEKAGLPHLAYGLGSNSEFFAHFMESARFQREIDSLTRKGDKSFVQLIIGALRDLLNGKATKKSDVVSEDIIRAMVEFTQSAADADYSPYGTARMDALMQMPEGEVRDSVRFHELTRDLGESPSQADIDAFKTGQPGAYEELKAMRERVLKAAGYDNKGHRAGVYRYGIPLMPNTTGGLGSAYYAILGGNLKEIQEFAGPVTGPIRSDKTLEARAEEVALNLGDKPLFVNHPTEVSAWAKENGFIPSFHAWLDYQYAVNSAYDTAYAQQGMTDWNAGSRRIDVNPDSLEARRAGRLKLKTAESKKEYREARIQDGYTEAQIKDMELDRDTVETSDVGKLNSFLYDQGHVTAIVIDWEKAAKIGRASGDGRMFTEVAVADPNQIKSTEPLSLDPTTNKLIPPSQWGDTESPSILFQPAADEDSQDSAFNQEVQNYVTGNWPSDAAGRFMELRNFAEQWSAKFEKLFTVYRESDTNHEAPAGVFQGPSGNGAAAILEPDGSVAIYIGLGNIKSIAQDERFADYSESEAKVTIASMLNEELYHAAYYESVRRSKPAGMTTADAVRSDVEKIAQGIRSAANSPEAKAKLDKALYASIAIYDPEVPKTEGATEALRFLAGMGASDRRGAVMEFMRQVVQLRQDGDLTENGLQRLIRTVRQWFEKQLSALREIAKTPEAAGIPFAKAIQDAEAIIAELDQVSPEAPLFQPSELLTASHDAGIAALSDPTEAETAVLREFHELTTTGNVSMRQRASYRVDATALDRLVTYLRAAVRELATSLKRQFNMTSAVHLDRLGRELAAAEDGYKVRSGVKAFDPNDAPLFQFAGESAEVPTFMRDSLDTAKAMAAAGKGSEEIRAVTGWFPGKYDGKMRWEIPDSGASFVTRELLELDDRAPTKLGDLLNHPALFKAYPELGDLNVYAHPDFRFSGGHFATNHIMLGHADGDTKRSLSVLLHETQHWIQEKEGTARGGNDPADFDRKVKNLERDGNLLWGMVELTRRGIFPKRYTDAATEFRKLRATIPALSDMNVGMVDNDLRVASEKFGLSYPVTSEEDAQAAFNRQDEALAGMTDAWDVYSRTAGEIEARDVQARANMTPEQLAATAPYSSENIAPEASIILFQLSSDTDPAEFKWTNFTEVNEGNKLYKSTDADEVKKGWWARMFTRRDDLRRPISALRVDRQAQVAVIQQKVDVAERLYAAALKAENPDMDAVRRYIGSTAPLLTPEEETRLDDEYQSRLEAVYAKYDAGGNGAKEARDAALAEAKKTHDTAMLSEDPGERAEAVAEYEQSVREIESEFRRATDSAKESAGLQDLTAEGIEEAAEVQRDNARKQRDLSQEQAKQDYDDEVQSLDSKVRVAARAKYEGRLAEIKKDHQRAIDKIAEKKLKDLAAKSTAAERDDAVRDVEEWLANAKNRSMVKRAKELRDQRDLAGEELARTPLMFDALRRFREAIDEMQAKLAKDYKDSHTDLSWVIDRSNGVYLVRSYKFHQDPMRAEKLLHDPAYADLQERLINFFGKHLADDEFANLKKDPDFAGAPDSVLMAQARKNVEPFARLKFEDYVMGHEGAHTMGNFAEGVRVEIERFMKKKNLAPEISELLGEIDDPLYNAKNTLISVSNILFTHRMNQAIREDGLRTGTLITKAQKEANTKYRNWVALKATSEDSQAYYGLGGLYASPEDKEAFDAAFNSRRHLSSDTAGEAMDTLNKFILGASGKSMGIMILGNPGTYIRNVVGNSLIAMSQGANPFSAKGYKSAMAALDMVRGQGKGDEAFIEKMIAYRILGDGVNVSYMREFMKQYRENPLGAAEWAAAKGENISPEAMEALRKAGSKWGGMVDALSRTSEFTETYIGPLIFLNELDALTKAGMPQLEAEQEAARITKMVTPGKTEVSQAVTGFSKHPISALVAPFLRFKSEMFRTVVNTWTVGVQHATSDNPELRAHGYRRLASAGIIQGGVTIMMPLILQALSGISDEEDQLIRAAMPSYAKNSSFWYNSSDGKLQTWDMTFTIPYSINYDVLTQSLKAMVNNRWSDIPPIWARLITDEIVGEQIVAGTLLDVARNKDESTGNELWLDVDGFGDRMYKAAMHVVEGAYTPAMVKKSLQAIQATDRPAKEDEPLFFTPLGIMAGMAMPVKPRDHDLNKLATRAFRSVTEANRQLWLITSKLASPQGMAEGEAARLYQERTDAHVKNWTRAYKYAKAAKSMGMTTREVMMAMKDADMSQERSQLALQGLTNIKPLPAETMQKVKEIDPKRYEELLRATRQQASRIDLRD